MNKDQRDTNKYDRACMRLKLGGYLKHIKTCCALQLKKHGKSKTCQSIRLPSLGMNGYFVDFFKFPDWRFMVYPWFDQASDFLEGSAGKRPWKAWFRQRKGGIITSIEMAIEHHWIPSLNIFENGGIPHWTLHCEERDGKQVSWNILKPSIKQSHSSSGSSTRASTAQNHAKKGNKFQNIVS